MGDVTDNMIWVCVEMGFCLAVSMEGDCEPVEIERGSLFSRHSDFSKSHNFGIYHAG